MNRTEVTGKTIDEALRRALVELGCAVDEVTYEVLEKPSSGFLGLIGGHPARLLVTKKETAPVRQSVPQAAAVPKEKESAPAEKTEVAKSKATTQESSLPRERAESFLTEIFRLMQLEVHFTCETRGDGFFYNLAGENLGILIGKHGQTLDALQYLTNLAANRGLDEGRVHISLDVEGYRSRREETLRRLAGHLAEKACRIHAEVRLEPMNRHERKIIHMALQDNYRVNTYSDGDEPYRCVVIAPKRRRYRRDYHDRDESYDRYEREED